jgi:hypothetical protein
MKQRTIVSFFAAAAFAMTAAAAVPDRAPLADEWGYRPAEGAPVAVNPPSLSWVHERDATGYEVEWAAHSDFRDAISVKGIPWSVYTHDRPLAPGAYYWRYRIAAKDGSLSGWSRTRTFRVPAPGKFVKLHLQRIEVD